MEAYLEPSFLRILFTTVKDLSFWTGFLTIVAFSMGRFNEKEPDEQELDPPLPNRCFTSRFRFTSSAMIYSLVYLTIYSMFVVGGSIPALQGPLTELFGSLDVSEEIGTPAWAAMILMVIAPTFKRVRETDARLRRWLMDYANIPFKARRLAEDIVVAVWKKRSGEPLVTLQGLSAVQLCALSDDLVQLRNRLCSVGGVRRKAAYNTFFNLTYNGIVKNVDQRYQTVKTEFATELQAHEAAQSGEESASFRRQLADVVQRNSRLIACALLQIAAEEYGARETIRRRGGYPNLESAPFRFSKSQIILGVLLVFVTCATVGPIVQLAQQAGDATPAQVWDSLQRWSFWGFVGAFSYLLPLVLAASVQLWLLDSDEEEGADRDWMFKITVLLIALVGCFMMAALPLFLGAIVKAKIFKETYAPLIVLFALVPACTAVLFIPISRRRIDRSHSFNAAVDFATFGAAAAFVSYLTASLIKLADFASQNIAMGPLFEAMSRDLPAISLVAFFVGGGFGALHCAASRQLVEAARAARARTAEMGFLSAAMNALR